MPEQYVVPQFLDVEAKIIGPITGRQFVIMLVTLLLEFIIYRLFLNIVVVIGLGLPILFIGIIFAFARVNGQPFHYIVLNMIQTFRKPGLRVWDKKLTDKKIKEVSVESVEALPLVSKAKRAPTHSKLSELSLIVNTGGVYKGEEYGQE